MSGHWKVDRWVERKALGMIKGFYPTALLTEVDYPLHVVFERLLELVKDGRLHLKWEIRCPNYECHRTIDRVDTFPHKEITYECLCGQEVDLSPDIIFPVFEITQEYRKDVRESRQEVVKKKFLRSRTVSGQQLTPVSLGHPDLLTEKSMAILASIGQDIPNFIQLILNVGRDLNMSNESGNKYHIEKVEAPNSALSFGDKNTNTVTNINENSTLAAVTQKLLEELRNTSIPAEQKAEIEDTIKNVTEEASKGKPNKLTINSMLDGLTKAFTLVEKSPALIAAFEKWQQLINSVFLG